MRHRPLAAAQAAALSPVIPLHFVARREAAGRYTLESRLPVGYLKAQVPYDRLFDRRFVECALQELGRR